MDTVSLNVVCSQSGDMGGGGGIKTAENRGELCTAVAEQQR